VSCFVVNGGRTAALTMVISLPVAYVEIRVVTVVSTVTLVLFFGFCLYYIITDPISDYTLLIKGMAAVSKTGMFTINVELFDRCPLIEQTYENFKTAFMNADTLYHTKITTAKAGYHTANAAKHGKTPKNNMNKKLTSNPEGTWYCWTHGIMHMAMFNPATAHNSDNCKFPAKGHNKKATFINMCGGNNNNCCQPGKKPSTNMYQENELPGRNARSWTTIRTPPKWKKPEDEESLVRHTMPITT